MCGLTLDSKFKLHQRYFSFLVLVYITAGVALGIVCASGIAKVGHTGAQALPT